VISSDPEEAQVASKRIERRSKGELGDCKEIFECSEM
jgi:hypothetical protein